MLHKLLRHIFIVALGFTVVSCEDSLDTPKTMPTPDSPGTLTIRFRNSDITRSQESDNAENIIDNLIIALYPNTGDETVAATAVGTFSEVNGNGQATVTMVLTEDMVKTLFNNKTGASCRMYAIANIPEEAVNDLQENPSIHDMKTLTVTSTFETETVPASFVMAGEGTVTYTAGVNSSDPGRAKGDGELSRAAAKIRLNLDVPSTIVIKNGEGEDKVDETWESDTENIRVLLNSGVKTAIAAPDDSWTPSSTDDYYNSNLDVEESVRTYTNTGTGKYSRIMNVPFYTYPNQWTESILETNKTTMTLIVPWRQVGTDRYNYYYYIVPVTPTELPRLDANHSYVVNLTVGMLGSLTPANPVELEDLSYQVVNWSTENIDINIKDIRYLVVNPTNVTINNEADMLIPFYSSHPVDVNNITMTFQRFNFYSNGNGEVVDIEIPKAKIDASTATVDGVDTKMVDYEIVTQSGQTYLKVNHALEVWTPVNTSGNEVTFTEKSGTGNQTLTNVTNSISRFIRPTNPEAAFSSYIFRILIAHGDNSKYNETIEITQYPAIYIEPKNNPGNGASNHNAGGNVFVNGGYTSGLGTITTAMGNNATMNANPNMYVINVTQLDETSDYVIGDPRAQYYNNYLYVANNGKLTTPTSNGASAGAANSNNNLSSNTTNWCRSSNALYPIGGNNRTLSYYYPTIEDDDDYHKYMIAPKFRVASSYGKTQTLNRNAARRRMATYQELNCPAGRWRLPTYGELEYICKLSSTGKIPELYSRGYYYWCAQGACLINSDGTITLQSSTNGITVSVRGIYDEWYWEQYSDYTISPTGTVYTYTLGDMPRTLPNNP